MKLRKTNNKGHVREFTKEHAGRILKIPNSGWEKLEDDDTGQDKKRDKQKPDSKSGITPK